MPFHSVTHCIGLVHDVLCFLPLQIVVNALGTAAGEAFIEFQSGTRMAPPPLLTPPPPPPAAHVCSRDWAHCCQNRLRTGLTLATS